MNKVLLELDLKIFQITLIYSKRGRRQNSLGLGTLLKKEKVKPTQSLKISTRNSTSAALSYLPAVQIWTEECGAQAIPLTHARWLLSRATGVQGTRTSRIIT